MKKRIAFIIISIMLIVFPYTSCPVRRMHREASTVVKNLSLEQKLGMLLMVGVPTNTMTRSVRSIISDYQPGGIILFRYNISDREKNSKIHRRYAIRVDEGIGISSFYFVGSGERPGDSRG
jgi:hypothetical protein